mmetsp:Transcript_33360/g.75344  ORF Transcript_33360/g.75344 Transcript_33360/m.75344 type:complete len:208 (-) Transcript_33360:247-870(-)
MRKQKYQFDGDQQQQRFQFDMGSDARGLSASEQRPTRSGHYERPGIVDNRTSMATFGVANPESSVVMQRMQGMQAQREEEGYPGMEGYPVHGGMQETKEEPGMHGGMMHGGGGVPRNGSPNRTGIGKLFADGPGTGRLGSVMVTNRGVASQAAAQAAGKPGSGLGVQKGGGGKRFSSMLIPLPKNMPDQEAPAVPRRGTARGPPRFN